jgi:hypothetical protein
VNQTFNDYRDNVVFENPQDMFNLAIERGVLSTSPNMPNYAGNYMYMHSDTQGRVHFKHIDTRRYIYLDMPMTCL